MQTQTEDYMAKPKYVYAFIEPDNSVYCEGSHKPVLYSRRDNAKDENRRCGSKYIVKKILISDLISLILSSEKA